MILQPAGGPRFAGRAFRAPDAAVTNDGAHGFRGSDDSDHRRPGIYQPEVDQVVLGPSRDFPATRGSRRRAPRRRHADPGRGRAGSGRAPPAGRATSPLDKRPRCPGVRREWEHATTSSRRGHRRRDRNGASDGQLVPKWSPAPPGARQRRLSRPEADKPTDVGKYRDQRACALRRDGGT